MQGKVVQLTYSDLTIRIYKPNPENLKESSEVLLGPYFLPKDDVIRAGWKHQRLDGKQLGSASNLQTFVTNNLLRQMLGRRILSPAKLD
ncbi:Carcinoembryonic antigen-related cell adhesion molecule [Dirofilaria immitis]